jgi:sigma-B regulation protein RsbU (phosphoserine phosphatase)
MVLRVLLIVSLLAVLGSAVGVNAAPTRHVLVLNSYHRGLSWTDNIMEGIESVLGGDSDLELHIEYMDTKRLYDEVYLQKLYEVYKYKYSQMQFEVVIVSDNDAFEFTRQHHDELFPGTPVVFCGINNFRDSMLEGHDLYTGVVEVTDIESTLEIALQLHPNVAQVAVVNDRTSTGVAMKSELEAVIPRFGDTVKFVLLEDLDMAEIEAQVQILPADSLLLVLVFNRDASGQFFSYEESLSRISSVATVPIYGLWDFYLGSGIVGGKLASGFHQGEVAARIAQRILGGEAAEDIPVVRESPNRYMFDYEQLQRFGLEPSSLPADSIVINSPGTFYGRYKMLIWGSLGIIAALGLLVSILLVSITRRKRAEAAQ